MSAAVTTGRSGNVAELARGAKCASRKLATLGSEQKNAALEAIAQALEKNAQDILAANVEDVREAEVLVRTGELSQALLKRLHLDAVKLADMVRGVRAVAELADPSGQILERRLLDTGLELHKVSCPLGVLAVIFEARPDAVTQISALSVKSGNAVILKGGREVERTTEVLVSVMRAALGVTGVPPDAICAVYGREAVSSLLAMDDMIDLVIPRGSNALVQHIQRNTRIPVLGHADGVCHAYVDSAADQQVALSLVVDSKVQYPAVCNALETVLIHESIAASFLPPLTKRLADKNVRVRGCGRSRAIAAEIEPLSEDEWHTEYSDLIAAVRIVDSVDDAIDHINHYGSHHTDAIITRDAVAAKKFLDEVDSANVFHNASTRFSDGYRYGFGSEVGISTSKLHARGPVGLEGLMTYKYKLYGSGQTVAEYAGANRRKFLHERTDPQ
jgi:glutamate-5-semialdehyde dehydrogenase